jgi:hypothetical protein
LVADKGSVITKDHALSILIELAGNKWYAGDALTLLLDQLRSCVPNQLPMYAENAVRVIRDERKSDFVKVLTVRLGSTEKESQRKRLQKVIAKLTN